MTAITGALHPGIPPNQYSNTVRTTDNRRGVRGNFTPFFSKKLAISLAMYVNLVRIVNISTIKTEKYLPKLITRPAILTRFLLVWPARLLQGGGGSWQFCRAPGHYAVCTRDLAP